METGSNVRYTNMYAQPNQTGWDLHPSHGTLVEEDSEPGPDSALLQVQTSTTYQRLSFALERPFTFSDHGFAL